MFEFLKKTESKMAQLPGHEETWQWQGHKIVYSVLGSGAPLILQHGISAASWAFEWRCNIEPLAQKYTVYMPDLPGYGRSERKPITYTAELYIEFQKDFAHYVAERAGQAPAVLATSLSAAHTIAAANRAPEDYAALILVCPTGLERLYKPPTPKAERIRIRLQGWLGSPIFWLLNTKFSSRTFLRRDAYYDPKYVTDNIINGYHQSTRQPNAKFAPYSFITFALNHSVWEEWPKIQQPTMLIWGREALITPLATSEKFIELRPTTRLEIIEQARLSPQDEHNTEFNRIVLDWLAENYKAARDVASVA